MVYSTCDVNTATDGTSTCDGSTNCLPLAAFVSTSIDVRRFGKLTIYVAQSEAVARTCNYEVSPDDSKWYAGAVSISDLNNNAQVKNVTESAVAYIRFNVGLGAQATDVNLQLVAKSL